MSDMARPQPKFTETEINEIQEYLKKEKTKSGYKKLMTLKYKALDHMTSEEVGKQLGYCKDNINQIVKRYKEKGMEALLHPHYGGNRRYLSFKEEEEFLETFNKQAESGQMLEVSDITKACREKIGRNVATSMIYMMLQRHDWRKVMPRSKHPNKADDETIRAYKKNH